MCVYNANLPFSPCLHLCPSVKHLCPSPGARCFASFTVWVWISRFFLFCFFLVLDWIALIASLNPQILTVWPSEIYLIISNNHSYIHLKELKWTFWEKMLVCFWYKWINTKINTKILNILIALGLDFTEKNEKNKPITVFFSL